jgi:hypothetical protein
MLLSLACTLLSGCEILFAVLTPPVTDVRIEYDWWNNLLNTPVIEGTITNNSDHDICSTTIKVNTYDSEGNCLYTDDFTVTGTISIGGCAPFKEQIYGSPKACNLTAEVYSSY